jgi:Tfp pilus assembly PilM family ATPase
MYGRFVGLDIGSDRIKVCLITRGLRDAKLLQKIQLRNPGTPEELYDSINKVFTDNQLPKGDIASSLQDSPISIRVLNFPFSDPSKIDQVYEFELENISPFDLSDKIHGYHVIKHGHGSEAVVCMFEREDLKRELEVYQASGIDPKVVTYSPIASSALNTLLYEWRPAVLIDIGATKMGFTLFDEDGVRRVRSSSKAGKSITDNISRILGISFEEAESHKQKGFRSLDDQVMKEALSPVLDEIRRTIQFFELELKGDIKTILLSGGTALMPGINDFISRELKRDVRRLNIPDIGEEDSPIFAGSYALALYGSYLARGAMNFRKGDFKHVGRDEELKKAFLIPALLLIIFVVFSIYRVGARYFQLSEEVGKLEKQTRMAVVEMFPNVKAIPKPVAFMESEVRKLKEKLKLIEDIQGGPAPLDVLRNISQSIPNGTKLSVDELNFVDNNTVRMRGKCDSYDGVARIEKALSDSGSFKQVLRDSTDTAVNNAIKFQITLVLK